MKMKRYQECSWFVKQVRKLWYIVVPFISIAYYIGRKRVYKDEIVDDKLVHTNEYSIMSWELCWSCAVGIAQGKMKYYYTHEEVKERMRERFGI